MDPSAHSASKFKLCDFIEEYLSTAENQKCSIPFIAISESWLKPFISDAQIAIPDYEVTRQDRVRRPHGGVLLYVHNSLPISETFCYDDDTCEAVVCSIKSINTKIASIYRPPNTDDKSFENLLSFLEKALYDKNSRDKHPDIIIAGDFNIPEINWKAHHIHCENKLSSKAANRLLSFMEKHFLNQYISQPTREKNV